MVQVEYSLMIIGILNRECDIVPPGTNNAAIPEEVTERTIVPLDRK